MLKLGAGEIQLKMSADLELVKCTTFDLWWNRHELQGEKMIITNYSFLRISINITCQP
jgi:hypothetical protein